MKKVLIYLRCENIDENKILDLKKCYSGIPDSEIMKHLINEQYILITSDRVLHNKVKISGKRSVYIDNNGMKALDASENYILENDASLKNIEEIYFSYVLIILLRLMLNTKKTTIYYDKNNITRNFKDNTE